MKPVVLLLLSAVSMYSVLTVLGSHLQDVETEWQNCLARKKNVHRTPEEAAYRKEVFKKNFPKIKAKQAEHTARGSNVKLGINSFCDWTHEEFANLFKGNEQLLQAVSSEASQPIPPPSNRQKRQAPYTTATTTFDWNALGMVTPVKDQGACNSCWAYTVTAMIESTLLRTQGKNVSLSEQELIDCSVNWGTNAGCSGGNIMYALSWLNRNGQVNSSVYPQNPNSYNNGANGTCNTATTNTTTSGLQSVEPSSFFYFGPMGGFGLANFSHGTYEQNLVVHINTYGLASQILWVPWDFQYYLDGIWDPSVSDCQSAIGLHSLVLTGYGTGNESSNLYYDPNQVVYPTKDYWVAKNSFGTGWGMNGYIYIVRNSNNSCTQNFGYGNWSNYLVPTVKTFNGL